MNSERLRKYRKELLARIIIVKRQKRAIEKATQLLRARTKRLADMAERYSNATGNNTPEREVARILGNRYRNNYL